MVLVLKFQEINGEEIIEALLAGKVLIYPTDTIYGIGCNAMHQEAVQRIRLAKNRDEKPFSVIAPSKKWIYDHFYAKKVYIERLPGPFTFIMKQKKRAIPSIVAKETVGIRIPDHAIVPFLQAAKVPVVTTSVNVSGEKPIIKIQKIPRKILKFVDIVIDAGVLDNQPSTVIDIMGDIPKILR